MPLTPTELDFVKSAIAQHGSVHCTIGEVTVVNLLVDNEVVVSIISLHCLLHTLCS
ncbi:hypothetical protein AURDEDRAFT_168328 [Auricularia subglabra TFB-10046 SS5]|nr:hypothetical protein AURDEDRAFT_168328 [Auricularia subglabra TFB-10046 SS5]